MDTFLLVLICADISMSSELLEYLKALNYPVKVDPAILDLLQEPPKINP